MAGRISARQILTPTGWLANRVVSFDDSGVIQGISADGFEPENAIGTLLPGMANLHTHSFQRAMAGLAERRGPEGSGDFWGWRKVMYRFLQLLTPDDIEAIAANVQMEMAESGFTASAEFHYLHHRPDGTHYDDVAETSRAILAASEASGIGLTHLPVLYTYGGLDGRSLSEEQRRFGCSIDDFAKLYARLEKLAAEIPADLRLGLAPHSLRAVDKAGLEACMTLCPNGPIHIHAAEQVKEVDEVEAYLGARPVRWLLDNCQIDERWCLIHATHMDDGEISGLAESRAVAGLCPTTEANLGDGIFNGPEFVAAGGHYGVGSDSNINISLTEELRTLEYSQRLSRKERNVMTKGAGSTGEALYLSAAKGGARALGRACGAIAVGQLADLVAIDRNDPALFALSDEQLLDGLVFAAKDQVVSDLWSAGRHMVREGRHINGPQITA
ncbi:MAG TPA: formimidoylglutamate deiminase [Erythrobacter sp.]|nr:formimidoylglutamate deiminase [Erythrobacter sp.]